ncbi:MAG: DUF2868 domain-containing protein [Verrucomicrobiae bacterium]|nr:DUF2868 domain-containing protein [Verrucomicrobiae bacterium]
MRPAPLRRVLFVQAIEKADADGEILPVPVRGDATREAARPLTRDSGETEQDRFFADRAGRLVDYLTSHRPALGSLVSPPHRLRYVVTTLLVAAVAIGWTTQALGTEKLVNILSFPLLGILAWNLFIYLLELGKGLSHLKRKPETTADELSAGPLTRLVEGSEKLPATFRDNPSDSDSPVALRQGLTDFQRRWRRLHEPVVTRRLRAALHSAAALLAGAAVAGMYAKGAATEYRAYWESTFFHPASLQSLLGTIFGPASTLSGIPVPDVTPLQRTAARPDVVGENAAQWIHLYALTIGIFVIVPRLCLGAWHTIASRRQEIAIDPRELPGTGLYFNRLLAEALGTALRTGAVAYSHALSPTAEGSLQRTLERRLSVPIKLDWQPALVLGDEDDAPGRLTADPESLPAHFALCFDFATTPEQETHGELIRGLRQALTEIDSETQLHVCLDAEGFDESRRNLADFPKRREERLDAWRSIAGPLRDDVTVFPPFES